MSRPGRNDPCPCGSGKKYKQCCLLREQARSRGSSAAINPDIRQAMQSAMVLHQSGRLAQAEAICRQVLQQSPRHPDALHLLGLIAYQSKDHTAAIDLIGRAIAIRNTEPAYYNNLGLVYKKLERLDEAADCYRRALSLDPASAETCCNLGIVLVRSGKSQEAVEACRRALAIKPDLAEAWCNLGIAYNSLNRFDIAIDSFNKALHYMPDCMQAFHNLGVSYNRQGRIDEAITCFRKALALAPDYTTVHDILLYCYLYRIQNEPADILVDHQRYAALLEAPLKPYWPRFQNDRNLDRRLKIAYLSPDLRHHSVAFFFEPLLTHHDRDAFEIYAYFSYYEEDHVTDRLRGEMDHWLSCRNLSDQELADRIRSDGIDILVDLAGHSANNRLPVFARKPAPVQVTWLGYPATTGLTAMDWRLTTEEVDPQDSSEYYSEKLWRLPHTMWCYRPSPDTPLRTATASPVRFGSMNDFPKLSPEAIALWGRILQEIPESHLVMTHIPEGSARQLLLERFAAQGVGAERLQLYGRLPLTEFYQLVGAIDIALDPFPYNGTTTTCESLWMGIPVVTLIGNSSVSRSGYALLKAVGLEELCARDEADYVSIAVELARNPARLNELRSGMRQRMEVSPLRDEQGFTRDIEAAYRAMWSAWCASGAEG